MCGFRQNQNQAVSKWKRDFGVPCLEDAVRQSYVAKIFEIQSLPLYATREVVVYQQRPQRDVSAFTIAQSTTTGYDMKWVLQSRLDEYGYCQRRAKSTMLMLLENWIVNSPRRVLFQPTLPCLDENKSSGSSNPLVLDSRRRLREPSKDLVDAEFDSVQ